MNMVPIDELSYRPLLRVRILNALIKGVKVIGILTVGTARALWAGLVLMAMVVCRVSIWAARAGAQRIQK